MVTHCLHLCPLCLPLSLSLTLSLSLSLSFSRSLSLSHSLFFFLSLSLSLSMYADGLACFRFECPLDLDVRPFLVCPLQDL